MKNKLIIDASNIRDGGGVTHLIELLNNITKDTLQFDVIEVFSNNSTLTKIENQNWISKKTHPLLEKGTFYITFWKKIHFEKYLKNNKDNAVLFNPAGTYIGTFKPHIEMSQNMLIWDSLESDRYGKTSVMKTKFRLLRHFQKKAFNNSNGIIFISKYAKKTILGFLNKDLSQSPIIHHGVNQKFAQEVKVQKHISEYSKDNPYNLLYISPITVYKHQIDLIKVVLDLYKQGYHIKLNLVGGDYQQYYKKYLSEIESDKTYNKVVNYHGKVDYDEVENFYKSSDGFIFASTCENMPNILIEAMSSGLPILCSNYQPMPEFLGSKHPFYFDPTKKQSVYQNLKAFLDNPTDRQESALEAKSKSKQYTWEECSKQTLEYLFKNLNN
ncbi:glycosyltransferase [Olleya namhaensis]|uniref:glycosyltransferase n=1 Tax=Olleya namhaensis TaxID=1144750 RepID=UPI0023302361|nr:glycosyltransferase [Olleya namhaensis]